MKQFFLSILLAGIAGVGTVRAQEIYFTKNLVPLILKVNLKIFVFVLGLNLMTSLQRKRNY